MNYELQVVFVPVSDPDKSKAFYVDQVGFHAAHDQRVSPELRFIQLTPPGSACSIAFGDGLVNAEPGSIGSLMLVVDDIEQAHAELSGRGVQVSGIDDQVWGRFVYFEDPDGNGWTIQQLPQRS